MADNIYNEPYIKPKVELTLDEYNKLVDMARMKSKKIERRARELFEKEGVVTINFEGTIRRKRFGELCSEGFGFKCKFEKEIKYFHELQNILRVHNTNIELIP